MNLNSGIRVLIADDHGLVRSGLKALIERMQGIEVIADAGDGQEAFDLVRSLKPDVVLADIEMPRLDGIALARRVGECLKTSLSSSPIETQVSVTTQDAPRTASSGSVPT